MHFDSYFIDLTTEALFELQRMHQNYLWSVNGHVMRKQKIILNERSNFKKTLLITYRIIQVVHIVDHFRNEWKTKN